MVALHCQEQMNERRLHNLKWAADKKCLTSNDSRSNRNQSNEENKPTNEITKEVHHSFHTAESFSRRISSLSYSKSPDSYKNWSFFTARQLSPFWVAKTESTPLTCPYFESRKDSPHPLVPSKDSPHSLLVPILSHVKTAHAPYLSLSSFT